MLIFQIKRIISNEKWFNYVVTSFFFFEMSKIWAGGTMLNGMKKGDGLTCYVNTGLPAFYFHCSRLECTYSE